MGTDPLSPVELLRSWAEETKASLLAIAAVRSRALAPIDWEETILNIPMEIAHRPHRTRFHSSLFSASTRIRPSE